jgi:hypothetical protein
LSAILRNTWPGLTTSEIFIVTFLSIWLKSHLSLSA